MKKFLSAITLCSIACGLLPAAAAAQDGANLPDFSGSWTRAGENPSTFEAPSDGPSVVVTAVPHLGHCITPPEGLESRFACEDGEGNRASNAWIADYTNPVLLPWTREALRKNAEGEEAGISHLSFQQNCKPSGVPQILNLRYTVKLLQAPDQVTILYENNQQIRRVHMNGAHPNDLEHSWYGHSIGHYEGDELVIDTIAQNNVTELDRFGTLHSDQLHVVERYRMLDDNTMQVVFTIQDRQAYAMPFRGVATYDRIDSTGPVFVPFPEYICAENNRATHADQVFDTPTDLTPDF